MINLRYELFETFIAQSYRLLQQKVIKRYFDYVVFSVTEVTSAKHETKFILNFHVITFVTNRYVLKIYE